MTMESVLKMLNTRVQAARMSGNTTELSLMLELTKIVKDYKEGAGYLHDHRTVCPPESNRRFINSLPNREFAELTINHREEPDYDYDYEDEIYQSGYFDVFTTSDGSEFNDMESAVDHEVWWLDQPHKEEPNG